MSTPREELAARIAADNPTYVLCSYPKEPAQVAKDEPYVDVWTSSITPVQGDRQLQHELEVLCYASRTTGDAAEAEVETIRDNVLLSVQRLTGYAWTRAERLVFMGVYVGYKISVTAGSDNEYAKTIRAEG